jgi:hypothetical protein
MDLPGALFPWAKDHSVSRADSLDALARRPGGGTISAASRSAWGRRIGLREETLLTRPTPREIEVLALVEQGWPTAAIAKHLQSTPRKIHFRIGHLLCQAGGAIAHRNGLHLARRQAGWSRVPSCWRALEALSISPTAARLQAAAGTELAACGAHQKSILVHLDARSPTARAGMHLVHHLGMASGGVWERNAEQARGWSVEKGRLPVVAGHCAPPTSGRGNLMNPG